MEFVKQERSLTMMVGSRVRSWEIVMKTEVRNWGHSFRFVGIKRKRCYWFVSIKGIKMKWESIIN